MEFPAGAFFMGIVFGIIMPLADIVSDGYLFYSTMNFKGKSLAMAGCRSCYNGAESYKDHSAESECDVCAAGNPYLGSLDCGQYPFALDKMTELLKGQSCSQNSTAWRMNVSGRKNITVEQGDACQATDKCCIAMAAKDKVSSMTNGIHQKLPDSTNWYHCYIDENECEMCLGIGTSHYDNCLRFLLGANYGTDQDWTYVSNDFLTCRDGYYTATLSSRRFERNNKGCTKEHGCCVHLASKQNYLFPNHQSFVTNFRCNDPCRLHINYLSAYFTSIYNWTSWSSQIRYSQGRLVGGKLCSINITFGYCLLVPIFLNWLFVLKVWLSDVKNGTTNRSTFIFGVTATYPIFLVAKYLCSWKNKEQMDQQKERFEREVATAEGYLESILQVSEPLPITRHCFII